MTQFRPLAPLAAALLLAGCGGGSGQTGAASAVAVVPSAAPVVTPAPAAPQAPTPAPTSTPTPAAVAISPAAAPEFQSVVYVGNDVPDLAAAALLANSPGDSTIAVRTGWEFNGDWQPWAAKGKEADYRAAYRRFVASFRAVSDRFRFEWTPNVGDFGTDPEDSYPGDDVVDLIGMDFYYNHAWDPADPVAAFNYKVSERYGLAWHQDFAARHGKPTAYAEWGVSRDSDAPYVTLALAWFAAHQVVYASYWNSNAAYPGKLSDGQYPAVASAYRVLAAGK